MVIFSNGNGPTVGIYGHEKMARYLDGGYIEAGNFEHKDGDTVRHLGCSVRPVLRD